MLHRECRGLVVCASLIHIVVRKCSSYEQGIRRQRRPLVLHVEIRCQLENTADCARLESTGFFHPCQSLAHRCSITRPPLGSSSPTRKGSHENDRRLRTRMGQRYVHAKFSDRSDAAFINRLAIRLFLTRRHYRSVHHGLFVLELALGLIVVSKSSNTATRTSLPFAIRCNSVPGPANRSPTLLFRGRNRGVNDIP